MHLARQIVQSALVAPAAAQEFAQGLVGGVAGHNVLGHGVQDLPEVHGWGQGIGAAGVTTVP